MKEKKQPNWVPEKDRPVQRKQLSEEEEARRNTIWRSACCNAPVLVIQNGVICQVCGADAS
jgi:hypothetical protein